MKIAFTEAGWDDYLWFQQNDRKRLKRINALIKDTIRNPFEGLGKPEPLKAELTEYWAGCAGWTSGFDLTINTWFASHYLGIKSYSF